MRPGYGRLDSPFQPLDVSDGLDKNHPKANWPRQWLQPCMCVLRGVFYFNESTQSVSLLISVQSGKHLGSTIDCTTSESSPKGSMSYFCPDSMCNHTHDASDGDQSRVRCTVFPVGLWTPYCLNVHLITSPGSLQPNSLFVSSTSAPRGAVGVWWPPWNMGTLGWIWLGPHFLLAILLFLVASMS